jgi:hypothetical protein
MAGAGSGRFSAFSLAGTLSKMPGVIQQAELIYSEGSFV